MSLMMDNRFLPALSTLRAYVVMLLLVLSRMIISFMPNTALMGVRISWDMFAKNSLLAEFARLACSVAAFARANASSSSLLRSSCSRWSLVVSDTSMM